MARPRSKPTNLPPCVYLNHGAYFYVKGGKWHPLGKDLAKALARYGQLVAMPQTGMPKLIDRAHGHIIKGLAPNTVKQYDQARKILCEILAEFSPQQVTAKDVAAIKHHYVDKPNMGNRIISYLRMVFSFALEQQEVESNPCVGIKRHKEATRDRYVTDDEFAAIRGHGTPNLRPILDIAYMTGQRIGDVLKMRLSDITDEGIFVQQQKTKQRVLIEMTPALRKAIDDARALPRPIRGLTLFCTRRGGRPYSYRTVYDMTMAAVAKAKVEDFRIHDLRAKALTDAKMAGLDAVALGGHADPKQTERYIRQRATIRAMPASFRQTAEILGKKEDK